LIVYGYILTANLHIFSEIKG